MRNFLLFIILLLTNTSFAQLTPEFLMPIWFEDTQGNKDTIWIGSDMNSSSEINPQFGEVAIEEPFDHILEVRAAHGDDSEWDGLELSKIIVEDADSPSCHGFGRTKRMIHATYFPLKISWDQDMVLSNEGPCGQNTVLYPHVDVDLIQFWWQTTLPLYCMSGNDHVMLDQIGVSETGQPRISHEVTGLGVIDIYGLYLNAF